MRNAKLWKTIAVFTTVGALVAVSATPNVAKADHPIAVAVIGAGAVMGSAAIGAVAVLGAATIGGAAAVAVAAIENNGGGNEPGDGGDGGDGGGGVGESATAGFQQLTASAASGGCFTTLQGGAVSASNGGADTLAVSSSAVPANMQAFMDRAFGLSVTSHGQKGIRAAVNYGFEADVMKSPAACHFVANADTFVWDLTLQKNAKSTSDYFLFTIENLDLTTTEVPDTLGRSSVEIRAYQNGSEIWSWSAEARQGEGSIYDPLPNGAVATEGTGTLHIQDFFTTIPFQIAPGGTQADVRVVMKYRGKGARI